MLRLVQLPLTEHQRYQLSECLEAYRALDPEQEAEYRRLLATEPYQEVAIMTTGWKAEGRAQGLAEGVAKGREQGQRELLQKQLEKRFGPLAAQARERPEAWPAERLADLALAVISAQSLQELGLED
jgi:hypothetical protein